MKNLRDGLKKFPDREGNAGSTIIQMNLLELSLIYKIEDEPLDTIPPFPKKQRVKISTFIVRHIGQKIGELFIKLAVDIAIKIRPKRSISLISQNPMTGWLS